MKPNLKSRTVFLGDNLDFLRGINSACVDLIYADPPFNKKKEFTAPIGSQAEGASFRDWFAEEDIKDEWVEEMRQENYELHAFLSGVKAMGNSYNYCYLVYMAVRIVECHRILKGSGSFYLHCDHTMSHYLKLLLDCIFGEKHFRNEIVWHYGGTGNQTRSFPKKHDSILFYAKGKLNVYNRIMVASKKTSGWTGKNEKRADSVWQINTVFNSPERKTQTGWPTQKPLPLMKRIVAASTNPGEWVLDPFCGCVTTCIAAEILRREWAGIDVTKEAWVQIERRLENEVPDVRGKPNFSTTPPKRGAGDARPKKYVYVISNPAYKGMYKVGVATNAEARLNQFQTADPKRRYKLEYKIKTADYKTLEPHIHRKFDGDHEWVPGDLSAIIEAMKSYQPGIGEPCRKHQERRP